MKRKLFAALLAVFLLFGGCGRRTEENTELLNVYFCCADGGMQSGTAIEKEAFALPDGTDRLHEALLRITEQPKSEALCSAFPASVRISAYSLEEGRISVALTEGYDALSPIRKTLLRACLVMTLCSLEEVESVCISVEERLLESDLTPECFLGDSLPEQNNRTEMRFWYPDPENGGLQSELRLVHLRSEYAEAENILQHLLTILRPYGMPQDVQILSLTETDGICTVDLSETFRAIGDLPEEAQRLLIASVVSTLTELDTVDAVYFLCEGNPLGVCGAMDLTEPLYREPELTDDAETDHP